MNRWLAYGAVLAAVMTIAGTGSAGAQTLGIGDPAPKITVNRFVKGQPVTAFQPGRIYVVEFWATWCGPCRESIPHLTELQKKYSAVTFLGVSVWERDPSRVAPFVASMGDKMAYRVATDSVPAGADPYKGAMSRSWLAPSGQESIPTAFLVDARGRIAWIGRPAEMSEPLARIVAGKWDFGAAKQQFRAEQKKLQAQRAEQAELQVIGKKLQAAQATGDPKQVLAALDAAIRQKPALETELGYPRLRALAETGADTDHLNEYGRHLIQAVFPSNPRALNAIAWRFVDPDSRKVQPKLFPFALRAAQKADELTRHQRADVAATLARAYFVNGNAAKAVELRDRALRQAKGTPWEKDEDLKTQLNEYDRR